MKTVISDRGAIVRAVNEAVRDTVGTVALAWCEDTDFVDVSGKRLIQVMDFENGALSGKKNYDVLAADYDGEEIALCVLGLGYKGQIGFNEVATPFDSRVHTQKLTESTLSQFGNLAEHGVTLGIKDITDAKNIIVVAFGEEKSDAVFGMLYGRDDSTVPAAFLQVPPNVTCYLDSDAASKL